MCILDLIHSYTDNERFDFKLPNIFRRFSGCNGYPLIYIYITYVEFLVDDDALTGVRIKITRKTYLYTRTVNM